MKLGLKRSIALMLVVMISLSLVAGCGQTSASPQVQPTQPTQSAQAEQPTQNLTERVVTDMAGRTVTIPAEINSVATFLSVPIINGLVGLMGYSDKLVNELTQSMVKGSKHQFQYEVAPQIKGAPFVTTADGEVITEEVLRLDPDLCVVLSKDMIEPLEKIGMTVVYYEWQTVEDIRKAVTLMGDVFGVPEVATDYLDYFDKTVAKAQELTKDLKEEDKKTVLYGNATDLTQPHVIAEWWIPAAGGISVTDNGRTTGTGFKYTLEELLRWNPDAMIPTGKKIIDEIKADPVLAQINAVKNDEFFVMPTVAHVWGNRTVEIPLTILLTTHKLYPELYSREELAEEIKYFYSHFFKYEMTGQQIDAIIDADDFPAK